MKILNLLMFVIFILTPLNIDAAREYKFENEFGTKGEGEGQFGKTIYMGFGPDDAIYLTDTDHLKIHKFSNTGRFIIDIKQTDTSEFRFINPTRIAIGSDSSIYVMDWILKHISNTTQPKIYNYGACIHKFDANGQFVTSFPLQDFSKRIENYELATPGLDDDGNYALIIPQGDTEREFLLTIDSSDNIYVVDDGVIIKLDNTGKVISRFAISQIGVGQTFHPADIKADKSGNIYVVDEKAHRVVKFNSSGKFINAFGGFGDDDGQFIAPVQMSILEDGSILVADKAKYIKDFLTTLPKRLDDPTQRYDGFSHTFRYRLKRIQRFSANGKFLDKTLVPFKREVESDNSLQLKGIDSKGNLYYLNPTLLRFRKYVPKSSLFSSMFQTELKLRYARGVEDIEIDNQDDLDADLYTKSDFDEQIVQDSVGADFTIAYDFDENYRIGLSNQFTLLRMTDTSFYRAQDFADFRGTFNQDDRSTETTWDNRIQLDFTWRRDPSVYNYREARVYAYLSTIRLDFINDALDSTNYRFFDFYARLSDWGGGVYVDISRQLRLTLEISHFVGKNNYTYIDETDDLYATGFQEADTYQIILLINGLF